MRPRFPIVTAHSGCMGARPNGPEHVRRALAAGADMIELDIRLSADGRVVLSHDPDLALPGGGRAALRDLSFAQMLALGPYPGGAPRILDLDAALDLMEGSAATVNLDVKEPAAATVAAAAVRRRGLADAVLFTGLEPEAAALLRESLGGYARLLNADPILPASGYGRDAMRAAVRTARDCGCMGLNLDFRAAGEELMDYAAPRCLPVCLWTVDEGADMAFALGLEPYSITTNRPDRLLEMMNVKGRKA